VASARNGVMKSMLAMPSMAAKIESNVEMKAKSNESSYGGEGG